MDLDHELIIRGFGEMTEDLLGRLKDYDCTVGFMGADLHVHFSDVLEGPSIARCVAAAQMIQNTSARSPTG